MCIFLYCTFLLNILHALNLASFCQIYHRLRFTNTSGILSSACCKPAPFSGSKQRQSKFRPFLGATLFIAKILFCLPKLPRQRWHYDSCPKAVDVGSPDIRNLHCSSLVVCLRNASPHNWRGALRDETKTFARIFRVAGANKNKPKLLSTGQLTYSFYWFYCLVLSKNNFNKIMLIISRLTNNSLINFRAKCQC